MNLIEGCVGKEILFDDKQDLIQQLVELRQAFRNLSTGCYQRTTHFPVIVDKTQMAELVGYEVAAGHVIRGINGALEVLNKKTEVTV